MRESARKQGTGMGGVTSEPSAFGDSGPRSRTVRQGVRWRAICMEFNAGFESEGAGGFGRRPGARCWQRSQLAWGPGGLGCCRSVSPEHGFGVPGRRMAAATGRADPPRTGCLAAQAAVAPRPCHSGIGRQTEVRVVQDPPVRTGEGMVGRQDGSEGPGNRARQGRGGNDRSP